MYVVDINTHDLFSFYTIWFLEHYREIVGYMPTPGQKVGAIFWNITITVEFKS